MPREGESILRTEDVIRSIEENKDSVCLVWMSGVHYFTGQFMDIGAITEHAHKHGIIIGWDLAHTIGNVDLHLHEWYNTPTEPSLRIDTTFCFPLTYWSESIGSYRGVDFACWCSYKYLNGGPGAPGGIFVHEKWSKPNMKLKRFAGWWGEKRHSRFQMNQIQDPWDGAYGWHMSNPVMLV